MGGHLRRGAGMREDRAVRTRIALAVGAVVLLHALSVAAAPKVFVRGFRGPQAGDIKAGVARAIRGSVEVVGSARGADAILDGSVDKKGLSWVLSVKGKAPSRSERSVEAAADCVEWPDTYSGKGGVARRGSQVGAR